MSPCESTLLAAKLIPVWVVGIQGCLLPERRRAIEFAYAITVQPITQFLSLLPGIYRSVSKGRLPCSNGG